MSSTPEHGATSTRATASGWSQALPAPRIAVELARVELRQGLRRLAAQDYWVLYGLFSLFGLLLGSWRAFVLGREAGTALAAGTATWFLSGGVGTLWGVLWVFLTGVVVVHVIGSSGDVAHDGHYLTVRPTADVAAGKLLAAACSFAVFVFVPVLACFLGLAVGHGTPIPLLGGVLAATVATATAVGVPGGFVLKGVVRRSALLTRLKPVLAVATLVAYVVVILTGEVTAMVSGLQPVLRSPPLGWLADLSLVTTPDAGASPVGVVGALAGGIATVVGGTLVATPSARYAWDADRVQPADDTDADATPPTHPVEALLATVTRAPATRAVASTTLLRVYRSPLQLVFVVAPLVLAVPMADALLATGSLPWYAPWVAVWYGAWAAGAAVPLNPLGNQGAALPALLTAPADGRQVVHGTVLAAVLPAAPPTATAAVALGILGNRPPLTLAVVAAAAVATVVAASVLAAGIGCVFPRFDAMSITGSRRAVPPSKVAYGAFSTTLTLAVGALAVVHDDFARRVVAVLVSRRLPMDLTGNDTVLTPLGWAVLAVVVLAVPVAYRVAIRRIDGYHVS